MAASLVDEVDLENGDHIEMLAMRLAQREAESQDALVGAFGVRRDSTGQLELRAAAAGMREDLEAECIQTNNENDEECSSDENLAVATPVSVDLPRAREWSERTEGEESRRDKSNTLRGNPGKLFGALCLMSSVTLIIILVLAGRNGGGSEEDSVFKPMYTKSQEERLILMLPEYSLAAIQEDLESPQGRAFKWTLKDPNFESMPEWRILQRFALVTFFYSTGK